MWIEYLIEQGADVNYEVTGDETPLINAAWSGHFDIVKLLVDNGADVNKSSRESYFFSSRLRTPLKMAKLEGHTDIVNYLMEKGAKN